jgi:hypothetical protein
MQVVEIRSPSHQLIKQISSMDADNFQRRRSKSQRAKEDYDRFGKFTAKHLRIRENLMARVDDPCTRNNMGGEALSSNSPTKGAGKSRKR